MPVLLGKDVAGFSAGTILRLRIQWKEELDQWNKVVWRVKTMSTFGLTAFISKHGWKMVSNAWMTESKEEANKAFDVFIEKYKVKYPQAALCLEKDREDLLAFYDFPAEHWKHIRTTNPIESTFATVKHRTKRSKGFLSRAMALVMVFKLIKDSEKTWRRLEVRSSCQKSSLVLS